MKKALYIDYLKKSAVIWLLLILCTYCILACEFEELRVGLFSIKKDIVFVDKINNILKNISYSYIAGVIFFFLSDTIPFLRRKKIVDKNVEKTMRLMLCAIDSFSETINGKKWDNNTDVVSIYEDISGCEYSDNMPMMRLQKHLLANFGQLVNKMDKYIDFVISQELYVSIDLVNDLEKIRIDENYQFVSSFCNVEKEEEYIDAKKLVDSFDYIINIKQTISKYI